MGVFQMLALMTSLRAPLVSYIPFRCSIWVLKVFRLVVKMSAHALDMNYVFFYNQC